MNKFSLGFFIAWIIIAFGSTLNANEKLQEVIPNKDLLPEEFKVYYKKNVGLSKTNFKGSSEKLIPTSNLFEGSPGCYIACYSKNKLEAAYHLLDKVYLMGQIRVQGNYMDGLCIPKGYEDKDMRTAKEFKDKCELEFPAKCKQGSCWASGKTADWF